MKRSRKGQTSFIIRIIDSALLSKVFGRRGHGDFPPGLSGEARISQEQLWKDAAELCAHESDYWWHKGNFDQCIRCLETAILLEPDYADWYSSVAWLQWSEGRDAESIDTLKRGIAAVPNDPDAYFALGFHYFNTKRYQLAEEPMRKSVELGNDQRYRRMYAHCLEHLGKLDEALDQWNLLVKEHPNDAVVLKNRDKVLQLVKEKQKNG
jgi:tetratricopeptide (TPR) repeat protein